MSKRTLSHLAIGIGLTALAWLIYEVGPRRLLEQMIAVGPVFPLVLLIEALSNSTSHAGWYYAFEPSDRPPYRTLLLASFASFSVAGSLPTGQAGEVAKWNLVRGMSRSSELLSSLLVYNYLHVAVTLGCVVVGPVAALWAGVFAPDLVWLTLGVAAVAFAVAAAGGKLLAAGLLEALLRRLGRWRWFPWKPSEKAIGWVEQVDHSLRGAFGRRGDLLRACFWLVIGRVFSGVEIYVILAALGTSDSVVVSLMVFSTTAVVNYLLMVLPAREGFLEASTLGVFRMLGMAGADGLSLELTRRLRKIFYQGVGIGLMVALSRRKGGST